MPIVTTKSLGIGASEADPKPATAFDYAGQPIKPGGFYNGRPEHQGPNATHVERAAKARTPRSRAMTAERRKAFGDRMRAYWAARKANAATGT
jgi:hypothetical protein